MARGRTASDNRATLLKARQRKQYSRELHPRKTFAEAMRYKLKLAVADTRKALEDARYKLAFDAASFRSRINTLLSEEPDDASLEGWSAAAAQLLKDTDREIQRRNEDLRSRAHQVSSTTWYR